MRIDQVAVQTYTVRDYLQSPKNVVESLKKIRKIGFQAVQLSGLGPIDEDELVRILDGEGLVCCSTHEDADDILDRPEQVLEKLQKLGSPSTAYPYPKNISFTDVASVQSLARRLNHSGKILSDGGKILAYHNHHIEFRKIGGGTILEQLYVLTAPEYLAGEPDTYWIQAGGESPAAWCRKLNGRLPLLHMKDYGIDDESNPCFREIGRGNLNWPSIIRAAEESGCQWFIVEQDKNWEGNDPFTSLKISFEFIRDHLVQQSGLEM